MFSSFDLAEDLVEEQKTHLKFSMEETVLNFFVSYKTQIKSIGIY